MKYLFLATLLLLCISCSDDSGPPSVNATSDSIPTLEKRIEFLETYVTFRRDYKALEYTIYYQNNGSRGVPAPSEWDIQIVSVVPPDQLGQWIVGDRLEDSVKIPSWVINTGNSIDTGSISEWYRDGNRLVGVDRIKNVIAYRMETR